MTRSPMNKEIIVQQTLVGRSIRIRMHHLLETVTFCARIVAETDAEVSVIIPESVRALPWSQFKEGSCYRFSRADALRSLV